MSPHHAPPRLEAPHPLWVDGGPGPVLRRCLHAATAAASVYNSQPWRFRPGPDGVDVLADRSRRLGVVDPRGREMLLSVGAAVFNLRVALLAHGLLPVLRLFPERHEPDLVARATVMSYTRITPTVAALARAIPRRHTNRRPFTDIPVPAEALTDLAAAAWAEGASLTVADTGGQRWIRDVVRTAELRWQADPRYRAELARWTDATNERLDGVTPEAFGPWSVGDSMPLRDFGLVWPARRRGVAAFEPMPTIVVLSTGSDTRQAWVRAGQALERVLLTAAVHGLTSTPMTQPVEIDDLRVLLSRATRGRVPQAVLRLGYGPPCPPSRRRPLDELLVPATASSPSR